MYLFNITFEIHIKRFLWVEITMKSTGYINGKSTMNGNRQTFINDRPYSLCLQGEVKFLRSVNKDLLIDPNKILDEGMGAVKWANCMAFFA